MRALVFLVVLLSAWYIAAAYRFRLLLSLCVAEGLLFLLLPLMAAYLRTRIRVTFADRTAEAVRGEGRLCGFRVRNSSGLPAGRLELRLDVSWLREIPQKPSEPELLTRRRRGGKKPVKKPTKQKNKRQAAPQHGQNGKGRTPRRERNRPPRRERNRLRRRERNRLRHRGQHGEQIRLEGGAERGESRLNFSIRSEHCGLLAVRLARVRVYDCLLLFHASRRTTEELRLAVYPAEARLRVSLAGSDWDGTARTMPIPGDESGEVLKIREYQPGDPLRRVHWNQSARTDRLWIKEFPREADRRVHVLLDWADLDATGRDSAGRDNAGRNATGRDITGRDSRKMDGAGADGTGRVGVSPRRTPQDRLSAQDRLPPEDSSGLWAADAFYQVFYALVLGLLDVVASVRVYWMEGETPRFADALDREQAREILLRLYQSADGSGENPDSWTNPGPWTSLLSLVPRDDRFLRLTGGLRLYAEEVEAVRFAPENLMRQIQETALTL